MDLLRANLRNRPENELTDEEFMGLSQQAQQALQPRTQNDQGEPMPLPEGVQGPMARPDDLRVNIDGGSVTMPENRVADTMRGMGPGPTDEQYLARQGITREDPQFEQMMGFNGSSARPGPGPLAGYNDLRADIEQGGDFGQAYVRSPEVRGGVSERDAMGLTQGDRRNILRSQGVTGSGQIAQSKVMGQQNNMRGSMLEARTAQKGLSPDKRATAIGEIEALGGDPNAAGQLSDEQLLSSLTREKTRRQLDRENEQRELTQGTTMGKLEAMGVPAEQLESMTPGQMQRELTRRETDRALNPKADEPELYDPDDEGPMKPMVRIGDKFIKPSYKEEKPKIDFQYDKNSGQHFMTYGNTVQQIRIDQRELTTLERDLGAIDATRKAAKQPPLTPQEKTQALELYASRKAQGSNAEDAMKQVEALILADTAGVAMPKQQGQKNMFSPGNAGQNQGAPTAPQIDEEAILNEFRNF